MERAHGHWPGVHGSNGEPTAFFDDRVWVPFDIDGAALVADMREKFQIEIGEAPGPLRGKIWRLGLMGYNSRREVVLSLVACLADCLLRTQRGRPLGPPPRARSRL